MSRKRRSFEMDKYGLMHPGPNDRYYRPRMWAAAVRHGSLVEDLASAYNVPTNTINAAIRRYNEEHGKP